MKALVYAKLLGDYRNRVNATQLLFITFQCRL